MEERPKISLKEYAAIHRVSCWVCSIPECSEVNEAMKAGVSSGVIHRWLTTIRGYAEGDVTDCKLRSHKRNGHHER